MSGRIVPNSDILTVAPGSLGAFSPPIMSANDVQTANPTRPVTPTTVARPSAAASDTHPEAT